MCLIKNRFVSCFHTFQKILHNNIVTKNNEKCELSMTFEQNFIMLLKSILPNEVQQAVLISAGCHKSKIRHSFERHTDTHQEAN